MQRINGLIERHHRIVLGAWLLAVIVALPFAARETSHLSSSGYEVPGSQSDKADGIIRAHFPEVSQTNLAILFWPRSSHASAAIEADIARVARALTTQHGISLTRRSREAAVFGAELGPVVTPLRVSLNEDQTQLAVESLQKRFGIDEPTHSSVAMHFVGGAALWAALDNSTKHELASAEEVGIPLLLIVLLAIFGSLSSASLPLALGLIAVGITGALIYFLSLYMHLSIFVTNTASMLGIGVAVDYSLIVLARIREELRSGMTLADARKTALHTSGTAIVISGFTVVASLLGVMLVPMAAVRSMALGAIMVVIVSVLATISLLPALITLLGSRRMLVTWRLKRLGAPTINWQHWAERIMRRPKSFLFAGMLPLLLLCLPVMGLKTGTDNLRQLSASNETRVGFSEAASISGAGTLGPLNVTVDNTTSQTDSSFRQQVAALREAAQRTSGVRGEVGLPEFSNGYRYADFALTPASDPESVSAKMLVSRLRTSLGARARRGHVAIAIGGTSASQLDEKQALKASMWKVVAVVLALAFLVLLIMFKSVVVPLKAVATNLLSVGAAYGVLVIVFQWGWLDPVFGDHALGHLEILTPPLILAIVFGLSMDYEVFLLTRIRERWLATGDSRRAVAEGLSASARTITNAAFILVCVFAVFVGTGMPAIKELGLGAAVAIGLDATLVRLVVVPAAMTLFGDWNWWQPRFMERMLERVSTAQHAPTIRSESRTATPKP